METTILLVEDDFALAMGTEYALQKEGYVVKHASNIKEGFSLYNSEVNLILLDVMLPDGSGYEFCKKLRDSGCEKPIIFLTAMSDEVNIVQGLEIGGDDYIAKPYRVKELMSRINVCLRRIKKENDISNDNNCFEFGLHIFYYDEFKLKKQGNIIECTPSEIRLLKDLIDNRGQVLTRGQILEKLYDIDGSFIDDNTLSVYVKRLRDKLGEDADYIETVRGVGYKFKK